MKQTAVEWLMQQLKNIDITHKEVFEQAKAMEKKQREKCFIEGYKNRALLSNLIFDEASKLFAKSLFDKPLNQNKMKQTAVQQLEEYLTISLGKDRMRMLANEFEKAKAMEKQQMKDAFVECWKSNVPDGVECKLDAEQYYTETYESNT